MKKVEKEDSIGLAEPKRSKVERTANKLTTVRPSNARSTMAKPRTTRFRPKNRKQPRTTRSFTFYEMTERHIIHSKFQWRTSQLDQRRSRLVLDTYGEGTFRWSFRTSKGQRRAMPKRLFQNCLLENKVNVVVPDGPEPINEGGVGLAEESESSHLSRLLSSDGKDKAPISTDQTNFEVFSKSIEELFEELGLTEEGEVASQRISLQRQREFKDRYGFHAQPVQKIGRLRLQSAPTSSFRAARPRISDEIIKPDVKAIIKHGSVHSQSVVIVRAQDSSDEKIAEEEAVCKLCFNGFNDGNVLKTVCRCTKIALIHEDCAAKWSTEHGNDCDFCEGEIQSIPITLLRGPSSTKKEVGQECKKWRWFSPLRRTWQYLKSFK
ncbi:hypothetical protein LOK49_LG08G02316 [Camellia lanceoleosa]|uniref:Uncharacterized protein n=1 Tax=Camellia lanceoleosa TaxID=1840588 RepID=A0ACC0GSP1_9ERIC|nr:hypothetical protein LOK49_LG08G02316 [Camellia lanceoleosa]